MSQAYAQLESQMLKYQDYVNMGCRDNGEPLFALDLPVLTLPIDDSLRAYTGNDIYVRKSVKRRLMTATTALSEIDDKLYLQVRYGYRPLSIQTRLFNQYKSKLVGKYSGLDLIEATHRLIASPDVAGHPTGGAIDIQIVRSGQPLDFGTPIWTFTKRSYFGAPDISSEARQNRKLLRMVLADVGFAPFDGEWWHFSYGDKEWAKYYGKDFAIYDQVEFKCTSQLL